MGWWNRKNNGPNLSDDVISDHGDPTHSPDFSEVDSLDNDNFDQEDDSFAGDTVTDEWEGRPIRHLMWQDNDHLAVLTQWYGSVWPRALPYCCTNVVWTYIIYFLKVHRDFDLTVNPSGHKYMSALMSFLLVTRLKITFDNYMSNAKNLSILNKSVRDLVANCCLLTGNDSHKRAKLWRQDVAYSTLVMLRVAIAVLEFRSTKENPWLLAEMSQENEEEVHRYSFKVTETDDNNKKKNKDHVLSPSVARKTDGILKQGDSQALDQYDAVLSEIPELTSAHKSTSINDQELLDLPSLKQRLAHVHDDERNVVEEASRAVYCLSMNVRREILKQRDGTWFQSREAVWQHPCNEETRLLDFVAEFLKAFAGLYKLITTPIPLPLVQMNKIFLFVWLFTLPMCLLHQKMANFSDSPVVAMVIIFIITFGFLGLEFVSMELTDPFGEDPSDFDDMGEAQATMEDCYIAIYRQDGRAWAKALRKRVKPKEKKVPDDMSFDDGTTFADDIFEDELTPNLSDSKKNRKSAVTFWDEKSSKAHLQ